MTEGFVYLALSFLSAFLLLGTVAIGRQQDAVAWILVLIVPLCMVALWGGATGVAPQGLLPQGTPWFPLLLVAILVVMLVITSLEGNKRLLKRKEEDEQSKIVAAVFLGSTILLFLLMGILFACIVEPNWTAHSYAWPGPV